MLAGWRIPFSPPHVDKGGHDRTVASMFLFGVSYAVASLGCSIGPFIAIVLNSFTRDSFAAGVWSTAERVPLIGLLAAALVRHLPGQRAGLFLAFTLADPRALAGALEAAGFRAVRVRPEGRRVVFESVEDFWAPIEAGGGRLGQAYRSLPAAARDDVRAQVRERLGAFESGGRLAMYVEALVAVAVA